MRVFDMAAQVKCGLVSENHFRVEPGVCHSFLLRLSCKFVDEEKDLMTSALTISQAQGLYFFSCR